jgi:hypothetical protein
MSGTGRHDRPHMKNPVKRSRRGNMKYSMFVVMRLFPMIIIIMIRHFMLSGRIGMVVGCISRIMAMGVFMLVAMGMIVQMAVLMFMG